MESSSNLYDNERAAEPFVWEKKLRKEGLVNLPPERVKEITASRAQENKVKLLKMN